MVGEGRGTRVRGLSPHSPVPTEEEEEEVKKYPKRINMNLSLSWKLDDELYILMKPWGWQNQLRTLMKPNDVSL